MGIKSVREQKSAPIRQTSGCAMVFLIIVVLCIVLPAAQKVYETSRAIEIASSKSSGSSSTPSKATPPKPPTPSKALISKPKPKAKVIKAPPAAPLGYRIVKIERDTKGGGRYLWIGGYAVINRADASLITSESVKSTLTAMIRELRRKHSPDAVQALLFESEAHVSNAQAIGVANWWPKGHSLSSDNDRNISNKESYVLKFGRISIPENVIDSDVLSKFTETKRKKIFTEYLLAGYRATAGADDKYPMNASKLPRNLRRNYDSLEMLKKNEQLQGELKKKYQSQVLSKYKINDSQMRKIRLEALAEKWPHPHKYYLD